MATGFQVGVNSEAPTRNLQNIKDQHNDQSAKKTCDTLPHLRVASVEQTRLETADFQNCVYKQCISCSVT